jgi:hypothetical protein
MVEPRIVVPDVAGSNPVGHPSSFFAPYRRTFRKYPKIPEISRFRALNT